MPENLSTFLDFARELADAAGKETLRYFQRGLVPEMKKDGSPVTMADRSAERLIRKTIAERFPSHAILGEEYGEQPASGGNRHRWIIDPIDGTKSFISGVPLYAVLVGLEIDGRVEVGVANFPALGEMVSAATGLGCWWNGQPAQVSQKKELSQAIVSCTDFGNFAAYGSEEAFLRLSRASWYRPGWGDAYGYMLAATGRIEVMLDPIMAIWDCGPFPPIFREAGGYFGDWEGNETIFTTRTVATSRELLPQVLEVLRS